MLRTPLNLNVTSMGLGPIMWYQPRPHLDQGGSWPLSLQTFFPIIYFVDIVILYIYKKIYEIGFPQFTHI